MASGLHVDFVTAQDAEVEGFRKRYLAATEDYVLTVERGCSADDRIRLLYQMHQLAGEYYRKVEHEILNRDGVTGDDYRRWRKGWVVSAKKVLNGLLGYYNYLRKERKKVGLDDCIFEPSDGMAESIQAFFAAAFQKEVSAMRAKFIAANLPFTGFDRPYMPSPAPSNSDDQWWRLFVPLAIVVVLVVLLIVGSHYVNPLVLGGIGSLVVVLFVVISAVDLKRQGKLQDRSFVDILRLALAKRFKFGKARSDDDG